MKKLILIIAIVFSGMLMQGQIKGIDLSEAIKATDSTQAEDMYNRLFTIDSMYVILYESNTVGVVHSHRMLLSILEANNLDFDKPDNDNSYLASNIDGYTDYEAIPHSVSMGKSIIMLKWYINEYILAWNVSKDVYAIMVGQIEE